MIVDEIAGRCQWFRTFADRSHIIRVPFPVFPFDDSDGTPGILWKDERIPTGMIPMNKDGSVLSNFCRAPYPSIILVSESAERGCEIVISTTFANLKTFGAMAVKAGEGPPPETPAFLCLLVGFETLDNNELDCRPAICLATEGRMSLSPEGAAFQAVRAEPDKFTYETLVQFYRDRAAALCSFSSVVTGHSSDLERSLAEIDRSSPSREMIIDFLTQSAIDVNHITLTMVCAFTLLNTRNVVQEEVAPSPQLQKKRAKTGKLPLYRYHVLKVKLFDVRRAHGKPTGFGHAQAIHWRRGHFKTYTAERPLLGRHVGRWWWQPNVVGTDDRVVEKSYAIEGGRK